MVLSWLSQAPLRGIAVLVKRHAELKPATKGIAVLVKRHAKPKPATKGIAVLVKRHAALKVATEGIAVPLKRHAELKPATKGAGVKVVPTATAQRQGARSGIPSSEGSHWRIQRSPCVLQRDTLSVFLAPRELGYLQDHPPLDVSWNLGSPHPPFNAESRGQPWTRQSFVLVCTRRPFAGPTIHI